MGCNFWVWSTLLFVIHHIARFVYQHYLWKLEMIISLFCMEIFFNEIFCWFSVWWIPKKGRNWLKLLQCLWSSLVRFLYNRSPVVYLSAFWRTSRPKHKKHKKNHPPKVIYISENWIFLPSIKKILIFYRKKAFLIFLKMEPAIFSSSCKNKRTPPWENLLYFRKWKPPKNPFISGNRSFLFFKG